MNQKDSIFKYFLGWLLLFLGIIIAICVMPSLDQATGIVHPEFDTMLHSGTSVASHPTTKWIAMAYGIGIIGILTFCVLIATRKQDAKLQSKIHRKVLLGGILYVIAYLFMVVAYWDFSNTGDALYFLGFPKPTAWMLFGMWSIPLFFTFFYIFRFDQWVLTSDQEDEFHQIVKNRQNRSAA